MKCPLCDGKGEYMHQCGNYRPCEHCNGTGKVDITNEEWLKQCTTEQLAEFLFKMAGCCSRCGDESQDIKKKVINCPFRKTVCVKKDWEMWLKQPYRKE